MKNFSGKGPCISFPSGTVAYVIKEHGNGTKRQNGTVTFRAFRQKLEKTNTLVGVPFFYKISQWEGQFCLLFHRNNGFLSLVIHFLCLELIATEQSDFPLQKVQISQICFHSMTGISPFFIFFLIICHNINILAINDIKKV